MILHPRYRVVKEWERDVNKAISDLAQMHEITLVEQAQFYLALAQNSLRYLLREERHPGAPEKKGDEA